MDNNPCPQSPEQTAVSSAEHMLAFLKRPVVLFVGLLSIAASLLYIISADHTLLPPNLCGSSALAAAAPLIGIPFAVISAILGALIAAAFFFSKTDKPPFIPITAAAAASALRLALALFSAFCFTCFAVKGVFIDGNADGLFYELFGLESGEELLSWTMSAAIGYLLLIIIWTVLILNVAYHIAAVRFALSVRSALLNKRSRLSCLNAILSFNTVAAFFIILLLIVSIISSVIAAANGESADMLAAAALVALMILCILKANAMSALSAHMLSAVLTTQSRPSPTLYYGDGFSEDDS